MKKPLADPVIRFFTSVIGLVVIFLVMKELQHIFIPFVLAYFLYFIFEPLNKFLIKNKIPSVVTVFLDISIIIGILFGFSNIIISSFTKFGKELPVYEQKLRVFFGSIAESYGITDTSFTDFKIFNFFKDINVGGMVGDFFSSTVSIFSTIFFVIFFFIFISSGHSKIIEAIKKRYVERNVKNSLKALKKKIRKNEISGADILHAELEMKKTGEKREIKFELTFKNITAQIQKYITVKVFINLFTASLVTTILWIFDVEFFIVFGVITFLLNFIPNIGSVIAVLLPTLTVLVQHESVGYALVLVLILIVTQNIIGNIIEPKIFGDRLGLNPIAILLALLLWGYIWGIIGMLIAVPLTAVIKIIIQSSNSKNMRFISELMNN